MTALLVTYDLNKETVRPNIVKKIKEWPWARLSESSYAVDASSASDIYDALHPLIDDNDYLFVIPLKQPYRGWGPQDVHEWLQSRLTY